MKYRIEVQSDHSGGMLNLKEVWEYKYLVFLFVRRDFVAKYKQNILGPTWFLLQPLLMTGVFSIIFGSIAGIPTDGVPPVLFYLSGLAIWNYFSQTFSANSSILVSQAQLYTKVYFPRLSLPLANAISNLIAFAVQLLLFLMFYVYFWIVADGPMSFGMTWAVVLVPLFLGIGGILSLGMGLWMSSLTSKYRDLVQLSGFFVQIGMYLSPVIYPLSEVPPKLLWLIRLNPMTGLVEGFRYAFLGEGVFSWGLIFYSFVFSAVALFSGVAIFQRVQRSFVDSI
jgi:lipopolysaccharide transport system permease protein